MKLSEKLTSRKYWGMVVGVILGAATLFGLDENTISTASGAVLSLGSIVAYLAAEGAVDASKKRSGA